MIIGLGTDLCSVARITRLFDRFDERFLNRVLTAAEIRRLRGCAPAPAPNARLYRRLAMSFAAKEAASKALGSGIRQLGTGTNKGGGVFWRDIETDRLESGKPVLRLHRQARRIARARLAKGEQACAELSLTTEAGMAHAIVLLYACEDSRLGEYSLVL